MAERDSLFVPGSVLDVEEARIGVGALWTPSINATKAKTGMRPGPNNPGAVTATGTPDGNVHVAPFQAILQSTRGSVTGGVYVATCDAIKDVNILSTPAHASLARNDLVIAHQSDTFYGDGDSQLRVRQIVGTPSGSPADPSLASYPDSITLARVRVDANATTIVSGKITDLRPASVVAVGGLLPVTSQALRDALTGMYEGMPIYRTDRDWIEVYDGSGWRVHGTAVVTSFSDLTAITSPYAGQLAYDTGGLNTYRYTGSTWRAQGTYRDVQTGTGASGTITFTIPSYLRTLQIGWTARSDIAAANTTFGLHINGDSGTNYRSSRVNGNANTSIPSTATVVAFTSAEAGYIPGATTTAGVYGAGTITANGWDCPHANYLAGTAIGGYVDNTVGNSADSLYTWAYSGTASAYTTLAIVTNGNFTTSSVFHLVGWE